MTSIRASLVSRSALEPLDMIPLMTKKRVAAIMLDAKEAGQFARAFEWVGKLLASESLERGAAFPDLAQDKVEQAIANRIVSHQASEVLCPRSDGGHLRRIRGVADAGPTDSGNVADNLPQKADWVGELFAPLGNFLSGSAIHDGFQFEG